MRSSPKIAFAFVFMAMTVGCAAPMTQLQQSERQYQTAQTEKEREAAEAAAAQAQAEAALQKEAEAGRGLATALVQDAEEKAAMVQGILDRAEAQRERACTLNPKLEACKPAEPPAQPVQQPAAAAPAAPAQPVQQPAAASEPLHVDVRMDDFTWDGMMQLTVRPAGWEVGYDVTKGHIFLAIDGTRKYERSKPAQFKPGTCYRFLADFVEVCPAATAPNP